MIKIIKELNVEVTKPNIFQAIVAKQYDMNTRFLKVTFVDCGTRIDIPFTETTKVVINAERTDGQSKGFDGKINEDGTVIVPLHSWMLELEGTVICDISVIDTKVDDEKKLTTTSFNLIVEKAAYGGDDVTNDPQYDVLLELIEKVEQLETGVADQTYNPESSNAQSGKAVAEALENIDVSGIDISNKMDKFGNVIPGGNTTTVEVSTDGKDFTLDGGVNTLTLNAMRVNINNGVYGVFSGGNEVISADYGNLKLRRLIAPTDDTDAVNKKYVDEAVKNIDVGVDDDKFVLAKDVSNIMAKSPNYYNEATVEKGKWWKTDKTLGVDSRYNANEPILVPKGKVLFSTFLDGHRRLNCIREGLITDIDDNVIYFDSTIANWQPFVNNYGQDVYVRVNIFNENHSAVYGNEIQIEVVDSVDDVGIHDYVPHPYGWYLLGENKEPTEEDTYNENIFADEITDTVNKAKSKMDAPCFAFAYVTDTHHNPTNNYANQNTIDTFCSIKKVCDKVPLHCVINGGDVLYPSSDLFTTQDEVDSTIAGIRDRMLKANENVFFTCGNHDGIGGGHPQTSNYMSMFLHNQDKVEVGDGGSYYYFDYSATKLRCIFLDTSKRETTTVYGISDTQYAWLENTINTTPENYKIMLFSHIPPSPSSFVDGVAKYDFSTNRDRTLSLLNNFNDNSGRVVGWFSGHDHFDWLPTKEYSGCDFPVIISASSLWSAGASMDYFEDIGAVKPTRNLRTVTQDAWNAVVYRPDEDKLYVYRFGAGDDRIIDL